jgi:hypothetical protein
MRLRDDTKAALEREAARNQRSLSEEVEARIERSLAGNAVLEEAWELAYGRQGRDVMRLVGHVIRHAPIGFDWLNNTAEYALTVATIIPLLGRPPLAPGAISDADRSFGEHRVHEVLRSALDVPSAIQRDFDPVAAARIALWLTENDPDLPRDLTSEQG